MQKPSQRIRVILRGLKWLLVLAAIGGAIYWFRFSPVVVHDRGAGVIVVTHDHRALDVFDTTYEMEDGVFQRSSECGPVSSEIRRF